MNRRLTLLIMGVAGSGKTTVGKKLAEELGCEFLDGDDCQPSENVEKLRRGISLSDHDRYAWFRNLREKMLRVSRHAKLVIACSALKEEYRSFLLADLGRTEVIYLKIDPTTAVSRLSKRRNHFFPASLCETQFAILEPPQHGLVINATNPVAKILIEIRAALSASSGESARTSLLESKQTDVKTGT